LDHCEDSNAQLCRNARVGVISREESGEGGPGADLAVDRECRKCQSVAKRRVPCVVSPRQGFLRELQPLRDAVVNSAAGRPLAGLLQACLWHVLPRVLRGHFVRQRQGSRHFKWRVQSGEFSVQALLQTLRGGNRGVAAMRRHVQCIALRVVLPLLLHGVRGGQGQSHGQPAVASASPSDRQGQEARIGASESPQPGGRPGVQCAPGLRALDGL